MKKLKERGISVRKINLIMFLVAVAVSAVLFFAMNRTTELNEYAADVTREMMNVRESTYEMQLASDYLTEQIRYFAETGDRSYLDHYFREVNVNRRRETSLLVLETSQKESSALEELKEAMTESQELMELEYYAAGLVLEAKGIPISDYPDLADTAISAADEALSPAEKEDRARELLFGEEYRDRKETISDHMQSCLDQLNSNMLQEQQETTDDLDRQVIWEHILTLFLILILVLIIWGTFRLMILPLQRAVETIRSEKEIEPKGAYEVRFLAKTYNLIFRNNQEKKEKMNYEFTHDELTGLYNRRGYEYLLKNVDMETSALLLLDLNNHKDLEDSHGREMGERAISATAQCLLSSFRSSDYVCRISDNEFAVIMIHSDDNLTSLIRNKFAKIREELGQEKDGLPPLSVSAGAAFGRNGDNASGIFRAADEALYLARKKEGNEILFHKEEK